MTSEVIISISGLQMAAGENGDEPIEIVSCGRYRKLNGIHYIRYTDIEDGESEASSNLLRIRPDGIELVKRSGAGTRMIIEKNKRSTALIRTGAGILRIGIFGLDIHLTETPDRIEAWVRYQMDAGEGPAIEWGLHIIITAKESFRILEHEKTGAEKDMEFFDIKEQPVGVFDSGVGGVSVLREMVRLLPHEDFLFFGDSANAPYGTKTAEEVCRLTLDRAAYLVSRGVKALVIACNTATSAAIIPLREKYRNIPVIGIEPALKPASMVKEPPTVLVMATPMTVRGEKFHELASRFEGKTKVVPLGCPGLVEFIENGKTAGSEIREYLEHLLQPVLSAEKIDAVVLGCTHYPFVRAEIRRIVGEDVPVLDGSEGTARELKRRLEGSGLISGRKRPGRVMFESSLPGKEKLCETLLAVKEE